MANHTYIFSMGHRNAGPDANGNPARGGASGEADWTPKCVRFVAEEFRARGATVIIAQEHDGDGDPNDSWPMTRQAVAKLSAKLAKQHGAVAYLSFHYNGSHNGNMPGFHAVIADQGTRTFASNAKDVRLAKAIARHLKATNTVSIHGDGTFPESGSGAVNALDDSSRLGEMAGTFDIREFAPRLILEAADFSTPRERRFLQSDDWVRDVYAVAIADGCAEIFGEFPNPSGRPASGGFAPPSPIPELAAFVVDGGIRGNPPAETALATGERMMLVNTTVRAIRETPRRQFGRQESPRVGPDIQAGQTFTAGWRYRSGDGNDYVLTPRWTRVDADDVEVAG